MGAYRYVGSGEHYSGIPARHLSAAEFAALDADQRQLVAESSLYELVKPPVSARATRAGVAEHEKEA